MSSHPEAVRLNLQFYRKAAKSLLKKAQLGEQSAVERIARYSQPYTEPLALHQAQLAISREQGFSSWPQFKAFLVESNLDFQSLAAEFIQTALSDLSRAEEMLGRHPEVERAGFYPALVLGDIERIQRILSESPGIAVSKGGPREWEPLLYVCFSRFASGKSRRAGSLAETARILLDRGADANTSYVDSAWPDHPRLPCLYGATGLNNNPALARVLLDAGAQTDDSESLYHSTEHADLVCLRLLLEHGASPYRTNALKHALDYENIEGVQLLLAAGADPNEVNQRGDTALHWAVWRGRSALIVAALLDTGVDMEIQRKDGRTAYALAVLSGQTETARLLESRGAKTDISMLDRFVGLCASTDPADLSRRLSESRENTLPDEYHRMLPDFASSRCASGLRALLAAGIPVNTAGDYGATAIHWACWKGYAELVSLLLDEGASLTILDSTYHATPVGWFSHGLKNSLEREGDYPQTARLLLAAGAKIPPHDLPTGNPAVDAVLRQFGLIE